MKQSVLAILLLTMLSLCACKEAKNLNSESESKISGASSSPSTTTATKANQIPEKLQAPVLRNHIQLRAEELESSLLGKEYRQSYYLPDILASYKTKLFFSDPNYSLDNTNEKYIGVYDYRSHAVKKITLTEMETELHGKSVIALDENRFVYAYFTYPKRTSKITLCDFSTVPSIETLAELRLQPQHTRIEKLNDDEILMFFRQFNANDREERVIFTYNLKLRKLTEIYRENGYTRARDIKQTYACSCYDGKIYLLMHQSKNDKLKTFIRVLDKNAKIVSEFELTAIANYGSPKETVTGLHVDGNFIFLNWRKLIYDGEAYKPTVPPCVILRKNDNNSDYQLLDTSQFALDFVYNVPRQGDEPYIFSHDFMKYKRGQKAIYYAFYPEDNAIDIFTSNFESFNIRPFALLNSSASVTDAVADSTQKKEDKANKGFCFIEKVNNDSGFNENRFESYQLEK